MGIELKNLTDEEIIRIILSGDKEAFRILVDRYAGMFFGYALSDCGDYETASDLVQESLITAYNQLDRLRDPSSFPSWVAGIIKNTYRNLGRKRSIPTIPLEYLKKMGFDPPDSDPKQTYSEEELDTIMKYVYSLPEKYREVVMLRYVEDFSYKKIAEVLNIPETTVTMRLMYAHRQLINKAKEDGLI